MERPSVIFLKSIYSGLILSAASIVNMSVDNRIAGAFLFSIGLTSVFLTGAYLYTGVVGNALAVRSRGWVQFLAVILAGNLLGTFAAGLIYPCVDISEPVVAAADASWNAKTAQGALSAFVSSSFCGLLMYTAWKANIAMPERLPLSVVAIVLCVMVFVLARFDHSIANAFLVFVTRSFTWHSATWLLIMIAGNSVGALVPAWLLTTRPASEGNKAC